MQGATKIALAVSSALVPTNQNAHAINYFNWGVETLTVDYGVNGPGTFDLEAKGTTTRDYNVAHTGSCSSKLVVIGNDNGNQSPGFDPIEWNPVYPWSLVRSPSIYYRWWMKIEPGFPDAALAPDGSTVDDGGPAGSALPVDPAGCSCSLPPTSNKGFWPVALALLAGALRRIKRGGFPGGTSATRGWRRTVKRAPSPLARGGLLGIVGTSRNANATNYFNWVVETLRLDYGVNGPGQYDVEPHNDKGTTTRPREQERFFDALVVSTKRIGCPDSIKTKASHKSQCVVRSNF